MDNLIEFSVSGWGITLDSAPLYFNLSWGMVIASIGAYLAYKVVQRKREQALWQAAIDDERDRG